MRVINKGTYCRITRHKWTIQRQKNQKKCRQCGKTIKL